MLQPFAHSGWADEDGHIELARRNPRRQRFDLDCRKQQRARPRCLDRLRQPLRERPWPGYDNAFVLQAHCVVT
jgi:hypothetical protein